MVLSNKTKSKNIENQITRLAKLKKIYLSL